MRLSFRKVIYTIVAAYFLLTCYTGYLLVRRRLARSREDYARVQQLADFLRDDPEWNPWGEEFENGEEARYEAPQWKVENPPLKSNKTNNNSQEFVVEIWGKAAIGLYLWEHILNGQLERKLGGMWSYGMKKINNIRFKFRTGPGVIPSKVPKSTENVILVLNGREPSKIDFAKLWLDFLPTLTHLRNVAVILLGNEQCNNEWIKSYLHLRGGPVQFVFLVYDSPDIDDQNFYQWPLGVATYRDFPKVDSAHLPVETHRKYLCNFLGTIYPNSSRETLIETLKSSQHGKQCYFRTRQEWSPKETEDSREDYLRSLAQSDLTLSPVGVNSECYRIYEALSYGSLPVVEDVMTSGNCGHSVSSKNIPLRLLKQNKAPFIYIKHWSELPALLEKEAAMSQVQKANRRRHFIQWYEDFKSRMRDVLVRTLQEKFFYKTNKIQ
ncbi:ribitol-5-phosphate xylosyltransferase 1-like [Argonauta hians]